MTHDIEILSPFSEDDYFLAKVVPIVPWIIISCFYVSSLLFIFSGGFWIVLFGILLFIITTVLFLGGWRKIEKSQPPSIAMMSFLQRRLPCIYGEGLYFTLNQFSSWFIDFDDVPTHSQKLNLEYTVRCKLDLGEETGKEVPKSGGLVKVLVAITMVAESPSISKQENHRDVCNKIHQYINVGGIAKSKDSQNPDIQTTLHDILNGIIGEEIRREGGERTWQALTFAKEDLTNRLIKFTTGKVVPEGTDNQEFFNTFRRQKGISDNIGLSIRFQHLNIVSVHLVEGSALAIAADEAAVEQLQREGQIIEDEHINALAMKKVELSKSLDENPPLTFDEAMSQVHRQLDKNSKEIRIKSSGNAALDLGGLINDSKGTD